MLDNFHQISKVLGFNNNVFCFSGMIPNMTPQSLCLYHGGKCVFLFFLSDHSLSTDYAQGNVLDFTCFLSFNPYNNQIS